MKISYNWLKTHIDIDDTPTKVGDILTDIGLEVEGIETLEPIKGGLRDIVVGEVIECKKHPNADNLNLTKVNINADDAIQIVCGAPNIALGQKVAVAKLGCTLYDSKGTSFLIKKTKIRGEVSEGMICSSKELQLGDDHSGILVLDNRVLVGEFVSKIYNIENDYLFDIGLTPNRSDAMSHYGVARDLASWYLFNTNKRRFIEKSIPKIDSQEHIQPISVEILNPELCNRYCGVTLVDVQVKESPQWLKERLKSVGITPKNNVVDITNFVLHDLGQPLHAFDASKIIGGKIVVKTLDNSMDFIGLDDKIYQITESDLMICDAEKPLCIAGTFGGINSGVTEKSTSIFLESAYFNPVSVRKTSKRLGLNTDASFRFERGVDPKDTKRALLFAISLMQDLTGCKVMRVNDLYPNIIENAQVTISLSFINKISGHTFNNTVIEKIFDALDFSILEKDEHSNYKISIPTYRSEVNVKEDVLEEILRIFGYNNIQEQTKTQFTPNIFVQKDTYKIQNVISNILVSMGFYEMMNNSMTSVNSDQNITDRKNVIKVLNPLSNELNEMRTSLLFSGLSSVSHNLRRKYKHIRFFEFGKTYHKLETYDEQNHLAIFTCGIRNTSDWNTEASITNFYDIKGIVEVILNRMGITTSDAMVDEHPFFKYALEYRTVSGTKPELLVSIGAVKKTILNRYDIDQEVYFADINWDLLLFEWKQRTPLKVSSIVKYPAVQRDFSILINHAIRFNDIKLKIQNIKPKYLIEIDLFDVYEGKSLPKGKKSYGLRFTFQSSKKTLNEKEVTKQLSRIEHELVTSLEATIRDH